MLRPTCFRPALAAIGLASLAAAAPASAVTVQRAPSATGVAHCQAALPAYEGQIRKRPLAIQNEGTANAFITCALPTEGTAFGGTTRVFLYLVSSATTPQTVTCTLVDGLTNATIGYIPKTIVVPVDPPGNGTLLNYLPEDNGGQNLGRWVQVSCNIPPGVGIGHIGKFFDEDIGA